MNKPFIGLAPYEEKDWRIFFGRDDEVRVIGSNLRASRLTLLYGESGVGKSSLLNAKLVHDLRKQAEFPVITFSAWSQDPSREIRRLIGETLGGADGDGASLRDVVCKRTAAINARLLIILDQFEEYFVYRKLNPDTFAAQLSELATAEDVPVNLLISIREDSLASLDLFQESIPHLFDNYLRLEHLSRSSARRAIEGPIAAYNAVPDCEHVELEKELAEAVIESITEGTGAVPASYLQLVMSTLWDHDHASKLLRKKTLEDLGGARKIYATHFDTAMREQLAAERDQLIAQELFGYLVTPAGRKQVQTLSDFVPKIGPHDTVRAVLDKLCASRITKAVPPPEGAPVNESGYEFMHDVLAKAALEWRTRREVHAERLEAATQRRTARLFQALVGALTVTLVLVLVFGWIAWRTTKQTESAQAAALKSAEDRAGAQKYAAEQFLQAEEARKAKQAAETAAVTKGRAAEAAEASAKAARSREEAEAAQAKLALANADVARLQAEKAGEKATVAESASASTKLALFVQRLLPGASAETRQKALVLALHAVGDVLRLNQSASPDVELALMAAAAGNSFTDSFGYSGYGNPKAVSWSPDGLELFVPTERSVIRLPKTKVQDMVIAAKWNRDGTRLGIVREGNRSPMPTVYIDYTTVSILERESGRILLNREFTGYDNLGNGALDPDLNRIAHGVDRKLVVFGIPENKILYSVEAEGRVSGWSPDGTRIAMDTVFEANATVRGGTIRDGSSGGLITAISTTLGVYDLEWTSDSKEVIASSNHTVEIHNAKNGKLEASFKPYDPSEGNRFTSISSCAKAPRYLAAGGTKTLLIWDRTTNHSFSLPTEGEIRSVSWTQDCAKLAVARGVSTDVYSTRFLLASSQAELLDSARQLLHKDFPGFTGAECDLYFGSKNCNTLP